MLANQLVSSIHHYIVAHGLSAGTRLTERALAEHFRVSRSPVRLALRQLAEQAVVQPRDEGGYVVAGTAAGGTQAAAQAPRVVMDDIEAAYLRLAEDRLDGTLPDRVTENTLIRRYGLTRAQLTTILRRMAQEGWVERLPGHGWAFGPSLSSAQAYGQSYRFRLLLEPAALLEPDYVLDIAALRRCQAEQQALLAGGIKVVSPAQIFDANTHLHETIAGFSGNLFILESLTRLNRVRRLIEYRKAVDREQAERRCHEHLVLIDLLLAGQQEAAADYLRLHLRRAAHEKAAAA